MGFYRRKSKYKNRRCTYKGIKFQSIFEANLYRHLREFLSSVYEIIPQYKIVVKPKTELFRQVSWIADFAIFFNGKLLCLVEGKGMIIEPFPLKIGLLEYLQKDIFERIILVVPRTNDKEDYASLNLPTLSLNPNLDINSYDQGFKRDFFTLFNQFYLLKNNK